MKKKIFFLLLIFNVVFAYSNSMILNFSNIKKSFEYKKANYLVKKEINNFLDLSNRQIETLFWVYKKAFSYDLSYTLTAIAWQESLGGYVPINLFDKPWGSCGLFHANLKSVIDRHPELKLGRYPSKFQLNKLCAELIHNKNFAFQEAVQEIFYWKKIFKGNWLKIWAAYNAGWNWKTAGMSYAKKIAIKIKALKIIVNYAGWISLIKDNFY